MSIDTNEGPDGSDTPMDANDDANDDHPNDKIHEMGREGIDNDNDGSSILLTTEVKEQAHDLSKSMIDMIITNSTSRPSSSSSMRRRTDPNEITAYEVSKSMIDMIISNSTSRPSSGSGGSSRQEDGRKHYQ